MGIEEYLRINRAKEVLCKEICKQRELKAYYRSNMYKGGADERRINVAECNLHVRRCQDRLTKLNRYTRGEP